MLAAGAVPKPGWAEVGNPAFLAAAKDPDGRYAVYGLRADGAEAFRVPIPARGHAGAGHPTRAEAVAFARRPGNFAFVLDAATGDVLHRFAPPDGHHFNGHGSYADEGATLLTAEQRAADSQGFVGLWDTRAGYRRMGQIPTQGLGPHELLLMPDGYTIAVANGGIQTDPKDRSKLNIPTMRPSLAYFTLDGELLDKAELPDDLHMNSIRHLAVRADGLVAFAMQWQGEYGLAHPLLGTHRIGGEVRLHSAPLGEQLAMQDYAGSVAFSASGEEIAITSPRGGWLHRFGADGAFLGAVKRADICGLATHPDGLFASDGQGAVMAITPRGPRLLARFNRAWDNHVVAL
ncbi:MAG: twin-arginine translocation pathway signal [Rhodobacterales bacterium]|nr:MAG: twin-arginine translocation pathway signal [Rhodobacterales bacterium]